MTQVTGQSCCGRSRSGAGLFDLVCSTGNSGTIGLHAGNAKHNTVNE